MIEPIKCRIVDVRAHPGRIEVDSSDGQTGFRVWLPRVPAPAPA